MTNEVYGTCIICGTYTKIVRVMQIIDYKITGRSFSGKKGEIKEYCDTCFVARKK